MRNLKKILALVLALVMSLSLMATASAAETETAETGSKYQTAIDVLKGLGVVKSDDRGDRPADPITRAEVAALLYRIDTTDVTDAQAAIHTGQGFTDVNVNDWYAGYVSYCYIAEIIKGNPNGTFEPDNNINGYATLAMILRAMGYGKNGEFVGDGWEIRTASTAKQIGILEGISDTQLSCNAARELVFEILFRALLKDVVEFDARMPYQYPSTGVTLGYKQFKLEEIEGVVVANEYANLYGDYVLGDGKTNLEVTEDDIRPLNIGTEITDIGESRYVYTQNVSKVLAMGDTGSNVVTGTDGKACDIRTTSKFSATAEMAQSRETEFYVNFGRVGYYTSDFRIEYVIYLPLTVAEAAVYETRNGGDLGNQGNAVLTTDGNLYYKNGAQAYWYYYDKAIKAGDPITQTDMDNMYTIFTESNGLNWTNSNIDYDNSTDNDYIGKVFVATQTTKDISDEISYNQFVDTYINDEAYDNNWNTSVNGDWVKFVDNNNDGVCDYAFKTTSWLDEATSTYTTASGSTILMFNDFDDASDDVRYMDGDVSVGDVVVAALIDGQILVEHAKDVTKTVNKYDWKNDVITTTDGDEYGQSGIDNATGMQELLATMNEKTEYIMYFDHFGFVRAYELPGGTQYALVTELYYQNNNNGNLVQNWPMTVELWDGENGKGEYSTSSSTQLRAVTADPWLRVSSIAGTNIYYNWIQPAIAHLGVTRESGNVWYGAVRGNRSGETLPSLTQDTQTFWKDNRQLVSKITNLNSSTEFNYGQQYYYTGASSTTRTVDNTITTSFTNVALVNINGDSAVVNGAAQLKLKNDGSVDTYADGRPRYSVDYVQLDRTKDVTAKQVRYPIDGTNATYQSQNNYYVNATHKTQYYVVYNGNVLYFEDYEKMPALTNEVNYIHAAYAVARDTSADDSNTPYWVADVIVYEVETYSNLEKMSISLAYYNPSRTTGDVQLLNTLNSKYGPMMDLTPAPYAWNADQMHSLTGAGYIDYNFYRLSNEEKVSDTEMTAQKLDKIDYPNFNENGIYAGTITRTVRVESDGTYIDINTDPTKTQLDENGNTVLATTASVKVTGGVYSITKDQVLGSSWDYNKANLLRCDDSINSQVKPGDRVIWVGGNKDAIANDSSFIVDLGNDVTAPTWDNNSALRAATAAFLLNRIYTGGVVSGVGPNVSTSDGLWQRIMAEQALVAPTTYVTLTVTATGLPNEYKSLFPQTYKIPYDNAAAITYSMSDGAFTVLGYEVTTITDTTDASAAKKPDLTSQPTSFDVPANTKNNMSVELTYAVATPVLTLDASAATNAIGFTENKTPGAIADTDTVTYQYNDEYVVTVTATTDYGFSAVAKDVGGNALPAAQQPVRKVLANGNTTFTGKITEDITLVITEVACDVTTNIAGTPANIQYKINGGDTLTAPITDGDKLQGVIPGDKITFVSTGDFFVKMSNVEGGNYCTTIEPTKSDANYVVPAAADAIDFYEPIAVHFTNSISAETGTLSGQALLLANTQRIDPAVVTDGVTTPTVMPVIYVPHGTTMTATLVVPPNNTTLNLDVVWSMAGISSTQANNTGLNITSQAITGEIWMNFITQ